MTSSGHYSPRKHKGHEGHEEGKILVLPFVFLRVLRAFVVKKHWCLLGFVFVSCGDDGRTPVVLYSPHGRDQLELLERDFERRRPRRSSTGCASSG
jgi:hypothetical protein